MYQEQLSRRVLFLLSSIMQPEQIIKILEDWETNLEPDLAVGREVEEVVHLLVVDLHVAHLHLRLRV